MAKVLSQPITEIGEPHFDDPSLALLFSQLKSKTLQTAKGTSEISGRTEFNFVLQMARVFCRMGEYRSQEYNVVSLTFVFFDFKAVMYLR